MIGVVVDMVFVYLIFSYIEERRRKKIVIENERRARSYLRFFIVDLLRFKPLLDRCLVEHKEFELFIESPEKFKFYDFQSAFNAKIINKISEEISVIESEALCDHIKNHISIELSSLQAMLPVISGVSKEHFKNWQRILYFMSMINKGNNTISNTKKILAKIKSFDVNTVKKFNVIQKT
ncbi:hypothetical protein [Vibrio palustris]|uniref:Uncharacterized protein n=1 Tax=Vibrio palustris TaxID=1918946 RepID=A0A1R4B729_9VIBR|nr:hypothetical protein [Vibrio palustris]SJL84728.1 hypothetical protein VPAL9027_02725 [Vibrio palustris]